jgi:hypothetical protein
MLRHLQRYHVIGEKKILGNTHDQIFLKIQSDHVIETILNAHDKTYSGLVLVVRYMINKKNNKKSYRCTNYSQQFFDDICFQLNCGKYITVINAYLTYEQAVLDRNDICYFGLQPYKKKILGVKSLPIADIVQLLPYRKKGQYMFVVKRVGMCAVIESIKINEEFIVPFDELPTRLSTKAREYIRGTQDMLDDIYTYIETYAFEKIRKCIIDNIVSKCKDVSL